MKKAGACDGWVLLGLVLLAFLPRLALLLWRGFDFFSNEEVMSQSIFAIMGKHFLDGKPMVYMYGQGYMGSLESALAAVFYLIRGIDALSLQLAVLTFYLLFLTANFFLLRRLFGIRVSVIASLFLAVSPALLTKISFCAFGGYNETFFFGSLTFLALFWWLDKKESRLRLFLLGLAAGLGLWTHNLILLYFFSAGLFYLLRSRGWEKARRSWDLIDVFTLRRLSVPAVARYAAMAVHAGILLFLLWSLFSFFSGHREWSLAGYRFETASLPFRVKDMKKLFLIVTVEAAALVFWGGRAVALWGRLKQMLPFLAGFFVGIAPMIIYTLVDDEGYRQIHASGMIFASQLPHQARRLLQEGILSGILGVRPESLRLSAGAAALHGWVTLALAAGLFAAYLYQNRSEATSLLRLEGRAYSYKVFPLVMMAVLLGVCLFNTLGVTATRYLTPLYFSLAAVFALTLSELWNKSKVTAMLLGGLLLAGNVYADLQFVAGLPDTRELKNTYTEAVRVLNQRGIKGGYAHADWGYPITFMSRESVRLAAYQSVDRIPAYTRYADGLDRVAYVFWTEGDGRRVFKEALDAHGLAYETAQAGGLTLFLIDRTRNSEKGSVP